MRDGAEVVVHAAYCARVFAHDFGRVLFLSGRQDLGAGQLGQHFRRDQAHYEAKVDGRGDLLGADNARPFQVALGWAKASPCRFLSMFSLVWWVGDRRL